MKVHKSNAFKEKIWTTYDQLIQAWGVPVEQRNLNTQYGMTHVNVCGEKEATPLVLFHGVGDDSALMWIYNAKELARHFRIYAVDTIGGPGKSVPNENYNEQFDDVVWIDEILDALQLNHVNMAGVSHGGYLVQYYAVMRPDRVNKVIALASSVPVSTGGSPMKTMMKIFLPEALFPTKKNCRKLILKMSGEHVEVFTDHALILSHYTYLMKGFHNMAMRYHKVVGFTDQQVEEIRGKCLYLVGEADPFQRLGGKELLNRYHMNTIFYPKVGHGINHEIANVINQKIIDYFEQ